MANNDDPSFQQKGSVPVPDPTKLTTDAVNAAMAQVRRDLDTQKQIIEARLDAMDTATKLLAETVNRTPTEIQREVGHLRELHETRFDSIGQQFAERDERMAQQTNASAAALKAALDAAKELNQAQGEANNQANQKTEVAFTQQIKALDARLDDVKERVDKGMNVAAGNQEARTEQRLNTGQLIAIVSVVVLVVSIAASIIIATR